MVHRLTHHHRVVVVSNRIHKNLPAWKEDGERFRIKVVRDIVDLSTHAPAADLVVIDASVPSGPGTLGPLGAGQYLAGATDTPSMVWFGDSVSDAHVAESIAKLFRYEGKRVAATACARVECMTAQVAAAIRGDHAFDTEHLHADPMREQRRILGDVLLRDNVVRDMIIGLAAWPDATYDTLARRFHRSARYMSQSLLTQVQPALEKLDWIPEDRALSRQALTAMTWRRVDFIRYFVRRAVPTHRWVFPTTGPVIW